MGLIILIVLIVLVVGALPVYPYNQSWGYAPGGILSLVLIIVLILLLMGRL